MAKHGKLGFTLIELLAVIVLLAIILAIAVPSISQTLKSTSKSAFESDAKMVLNAVKYKKLENENFDVTSVNKDNINNILGLSNTNYSNLSIEVIDNTILITIIGTNKWNGLIACGTYQNMRVVESVSNCSSDVTPPVITLLGDNPASINMGDTYNDAGITAIDNREGNITDRVIITSNINPSVPGVYNVTYSVTDTAGNHAVATRVVNVIDNVEPEIVLNPNGSSVRGKLESVSVDVTDLGPIDNDSLKYKWTEDTAQPASETIVLPFVNNESIPAPIDASGTFYLWVKASDIFGNNTIIGSDAYSIDNKAPTITMNGSNPYGIPVNSIYSDAGATAIDEIDGSVTVTVTSDVNPNVAGTYSVTYTATDSVGNTVTSTRTVRVLGSITDDSIIAAIKNIDYPSGNYAMNVNGEAYDVELVAVDGDTTYNIGTPTVSLGDSTADTRMLVVKYNGNLTIDSGVTVTATTRKKGMFIYVTGSLTNNGTISMDARGASAVGQNVYLWKNTDGTYEYVPATGAAGGATVSLTNAASIHKAGLNGISGINRATGGGGSGGVFNNVDGTAISGVGGSGTSYSGGSGGGATTYRGSSTYTGYAGSSTGGAGGDGHSNKYSDSGGYSAGGGAGNPGGVGVGTACCTHDAGSNGTGGLLILYGSSITNSGVISSNGVTGGIGSGGAGGSSGGGSINIFAANNYNSSGSITALGGAAQTYGSKGGDGSVTSGYIYNNNFVSIYPEVSFSETSSVVYKNDYDIKVTVTSARYGLKAGSTKYIWTTSSIAPTVGEITNSLTSGDTISIPLGVSGSYYLWVTATDNVNNTIIEGAGPFNVDNIPPVITVTGSDPAYMYQGDTYVDAGATATDNRDGSITVTTTSNLNPNVVGSYEVTYTATDSAGNVTTAKRNVIVLPTLSGDSIIAAVRDTNIQNSNCKIVANGVSYDAELITINGDTTYSASTPTVSLGDSTADARMLVVKYNGNLTIDSGVTVTATTRKKGMLIYVSGTLTNNGVISMTARGAIATGQDVYLWKNTNGTYEYVPAIGGAGAVAVTGEVDGVAGTNGASRATGGGGGGASMRTATKGGSGAAGTSYSGGSGGGGASSAADSGVTGKTAVANGGAGGAAVGRRTSATMYVSSGGAGNPGGNDARPTAGANVTVTGNAASSAESGTGGLLIVYANTIDNTGTIESRGSASNFPVGYNTSVAASGGSSGGGSVNIFYNSINNIGTITAQGGQSGACARIGGNGGDGSTNTTQISW